MNKKFLLITSLVCLSSTLDNAFPSPKGMLKSSWNAISGCGKTTLQQVWGHKYALIFTSAILAGGVIVYKSEKIQKFIKELLGLEIKQPVKHVIPTRCPRKTDEDNLMFRLDKSLQIDELLDQNKVCPCEKEDARACDQKDECSCQNQKETTENAPDLTRPSENVGAAIFTDKIICACEEASR